MTVHRREMHRELNEIEYFNWCFGQPYNMVVVVQIRGDLEVERLRDALDEAQKRHPLLQVNTEVDDRGIPWFSSEGVGDIPVTVVEGASPEDAQTFAAEELSSRFAMDAAAPERPPLMRVRVFYPGDEARPTDVVFTAQHVIADGLSMVFLVRDLLGFLENPGAPVAVLDAPASAEDILPSRVRRWMLSSAVPFRIAAWLVRQYVRLRFGDRPAPPRQLTQHHVSWALTPEQTTQLRARCRREGVSVQSAICTAFLPGFEHVHTPVSLRGALARPVGESVGLYVGAAEVRLSYREELGFWENARAFHRRLRKAMRNPFAVFLVFSKAVPVGRVRELGQHIVRLSAGQRAFAVTNLGQLDGNGLKLQGEELKIESFSGAVTAIVESSVLTVYTIDGSLQLRFLASEEGPTDTAVRDEGARAVKRLIAAIAPAAGPGAEAYIPPAPA